MTSLEYQRRKKIQNVKGNRDELLEKRRIEDGGYLSDDGEEVFTIHLVEIFLHVIIIRIIILLDETKVE